MKIQAINYNISNFRAKANKQTLSKPIEGHNYETVIDLSSKLGYLSTDWYVSYCFNTAKSSKGLSIDMDDDINKANIETIKRLEGDIITRDKLVKLYPLNKKEINQWANFGFIKPVMLQGIDGVERKSGLYDISDEDNARCIERLTPKRSRINYLLLSQNAEFYASDIELSKLGFGAKERITDLVSKGILKGFVKNDGTVVNMANTKNQQILRKIRNSRTITEDRAQEVYGISYYDLLRQIYKGNIDTLEASLLGDMGDIRIDLTQGKNKENFLKTVLLSIAQFKTVKPEDEIHNSLVIEIALALMPELEDSILLLTSDNQDLIQAFKKKDEFENSSLVSKLNFDDEPDEDTTQETDDTCSICCPNNEEIKLIDDFTDKLAEEIDISKFAHCLMSALKYAAEYRKTKNIAAIQNKAAADAILNYRLNYKSNEI